MTTTPEAQQTSRDLTAELLDLIAEASAANKRLHERASELSPEELDEVRPMLEANLRRWMALADELASQ